MESSLRAICFVDDGLHLVRVGEGGLETLLRYSKLCCDEGLERVFSESFQVFGYPTCRRDCASDRSIVHAGVAAPGGGMGLGSQVRGVAFRFAPAWIYAGIGVFAGVLGGFASLANSGFCVGWRVAGGLISVFHKFSSSIDKAFFLAG